MENMLIGVSRITNRLRYIFDLLMVEQLGIGYSFTTDRTVLEAYEGPRLIYGNQPIEGIPFLQSVNLLFEREIVSQEFKTFEFEGLKAIFPVFHKQSVMPFDIFAASFFLVSRYEEYLPFVSDQHGRFEAGSSVLFKIGMLQKPLINYWVQAFGKRLQAIFPGLKVRKKTYRFQLTYDIDASWAYLHKGLIRSAGAYIKDLINADFKEVKQRSLVLAGKQRDPFDTFGYQLEIQKKYKLRPLYFILFAAYGLNDKNISVRNHYFQNLIKYLADYAEIGIHPSYASFDDKALLKEEIKRLNKVLNREVTKSRQHFLRMNLPVTYHNLIDLDIEDDYTMGFAAQPGFRAGIADDFYFYDLDHDAITSLRIHPFTLMDGTLRDYMKLGATEAIFQAEALIREVKAVDGTFILLWHNETLSEQKRWVGWRETFEAIIKAALPQ
ncbi:MAG: polysaccharide deacetylase family protein [Bacteroidetes bacterium]|nr:polysaccharide deacetylase family protein [Bacteroidota bacterium]MBU1578267.1 polysaccharide deacetylase family protein [Bacteroidota bacterium]MBU2466952.1 polysaccharide deacetylase family protein [Bacteroidota bacterium]MBU2556338.1 polysaccharide deacetylase family protein [Bacteroidota bacterium]